MRASVLSAVILALGLCAFVSGQAHMGCHSTTPVYGYVNNMPILDGNSNLELLRTTTNGTLYQLTVPNNGSDSAQTFFVVHVWGSAYQQGYAYGTLLRNETQAFMTQVWSYVEEQVEEVLIPYLPEWAANLIAEIGLDGALDFTYDITEPYTDPDFYEEMHGLCDAAGVSFNLAKRLHMIPSITKGACSMFGAWGKAVPKSSPHLLQLRALDWDMTGPFRDFSAITVYHGDKGNSSNGHSWVNVGMVGFIAALTGISEYQLAISEIGVSYPDASWGPPQGLMPIPAIPFVVLLRDILKYDHTIDDSISRMANAKRDCNLILGVGDGKAGYFRGFQYSPNVFTVFDPENMAPNNSTWHPKMPGVVYWGMDWECPSFNYVLAQQLEKFYGNITPENAIHYISSVEQSGDNHLAFYDLTSMDLYLAFAAPHASSGPAEAYYRQFTHFNVHALFRENPPN